jgi:hypothetical protein
VRFPIFLGGLYLLHVCYAVACHRELYGDASWFLVRMISEAEPTKFYTNFAHEFYYSRVVAYWLTQLPTIIGIHAGVTSVTVLSYIFGATYFAHRLISLIVCYLLLEREEKPLITFPLLGLFAGSIVSDIYIVSEIHISTSFLWPIAILFFRRRPLEGKAYWLTVASVLLAAFTYESWAFFAPLLLFALVLRQLALKQSPRFPTAPALALIACTALNWCAILLPRDPANKDGFEKGTLRIIYDSLIGISQWHVTAMAAALAAACILTVILLSDRITAKALRWPVIFIATVLAVAPPLHLYLTGASVDLSYAITDRGFAGLIMQLVWLTIFLGIRLLNRHSLVTFNLIAAILFGSAVGQVTWQIMATRCWSLAAHAVKVTIRDGNGEIPCERINSVRDTTRGPSPSAVMCTWWATPYSLLQNDQRQIHALLTTRSSFQAFSTTNSTALPGVSSGAFNYQSYLKAIRDTPNVLMNGTVSFGTNGSGVSMLRSGFSYTETSQTWTEGQAAVLHICLPPKSTTETYRITFTVLPHLDRRHLPMTVKVRFGSGSPIVWNFRPTAPPWATRSIDVNKSDLGGLSCGDLHLDFAKVPASPAELGENGDGRHLGLALIEARIKQL